MMRSVRRGFSLMEVLLSTAILVGSSIVLIELATIGRKQASAAYDLNHALLLCQSKMDEIVSGISVLTTVDSQEFEDDSEWLYSVEQQPLRDSQLNEVIVTVFQQERANRKAQRFSLVRWLPETTRQPVVSETPPSATAQPQPFPRAEGRK